MPGETPTPSTESEQQFTNPAKAAELEAIASLPEKQAADLAFEQDKLKTLSKVKGLDSADRKVMVDEAAARMDDIYNRDLDKEAKKIETASRRTNEKGYVRDVDQARDEAVAEDSQRDVENAAETAKATVAAEAAEQADRAENWEHNPDKAEEMARAEVTDREFATRLAEQGDAAAAEHFTAKAQPAAEVVGQNYDRVMANKTDKLRSMISDTASSERSIVSGDELAIVPQYLELTCGKGALPTSERTVGRGKSKVMESIYESTLSPNIGIVIRRNPESGEVVSMHTIKTEGEAFTAKQVDGSEVKLPSKALDRALKDSDAKGESDNEALKKAIAERGPKPTLAFGTRDLGESVALKNSGLDYDITADNLHQALSTEQTDYLAKYRQRKVQQQKAQKQWWEFWK